MAGGGNSQAATQPNVYNQAAQGVQQAGQVYGNAATYTPEQFGYQVQQYQNPYNQTVTNRTINGIEQQRKTAINNMGAQASAAGAFGGSRHGVAEALTNQGYADTTADTLANLNQQGYQNAASNMFQAQNNAMQGAAGLSNTANLGFGMGQQLQNQQYQYGAAEQALQQQLINAAQGQFSSYTGSPNQSIATQLGAIGGVPYGQSSTSSSSPGLLNILSLGLGF